MAVGIFRPAPPAHTIPYRPIRVNKSLLPADLESLHERRWRVHYRKQQEVSWPNGKDYDVEEIPQELEFESAAAFKAVVLVTIYAILTLVVIFLLWRTQCCCYPLRVCCHAICSKICCCCCRCCSCCSPKVMAKKMAVSAVNKYAVGVSITADGEVTMREVEREELEAVKNLALTAMDMAKPV